MGKWIIAHRGASGEYPENTIPAFRAAVEQGADCVEMDVQPTRDRKLIIFHDKTLERLVGLPQSVTDLTWDQVRLLDVGKWRGKEWEGLRIPTLEEALSCIPSSVKLNVELKYHDPRASWFENAVLDILFQHDILNRGYVAIKFVESIPRIRDGYPDCPLGLLQKKRSPRETFELCLKWDLPVVQIRHSLAVAEWVDKFHEQGVKVNYFYSDDPDEMRRLFLEVGVDGILTNYPKRGVKVLEDLRSS